MKPIISKSSILNVGYGPTEHLKKIWRHHKLFLSLFVCSSITISHKNFQSSIYSKSFSIFWRSTCHIELLAACRFPISSKLKIKWNNRRKIIFKTDFYHFLCFSHSYHTANSTLGARMIGDMYIWSRWKKLEGVIDWTTFYFCRAAIIGWLFVSQVN